MKITIDYYCDETKQKARFTVTTKKGKGATGEWEFTPAIDDDTKDPHQILSKLLTLMRG